MPYSVRSKKNSTLHPNVHDAYYEFSSIFHELYNLQFPLLSKKLNINTQGFEPWMSKGILISRLTKISLCKDSVKNPRDPQISKYKTYRNLYNKIIKASKKLYLQTELNKHQSNLKKTWALLRKAVNSKAKKEHSILNSTINGSLVNDLFLIAEHFNSFFSNVANDIVSKIPPSSSPMLNTSHNVDTPFSFSKEPVTTSEVVEAMDLIKEKTTQDFNGISTVFLKKIIRNISTPLCHIFNRSLLTGQVPQKIKNCKNYSTFQVWGLHQSGQLSPYLFTELLL